MESIILFEKDEKHLEFTLNSYVAKQELNLYSFYNVIDEINFNAPELVHTKFDDLISKIKIFDDLQLKDTFKEIFYSFSDNVFKFSINNETKLIDQTKYMNEMNNYTHLFNIFNYIWNSNFDNKIIALGTGDFYKQALPNFVINDININNKKYEIILIDPCEDGFGCPEYKSLEEFLKPLINDLSKIKITFISCFCSNYSLYLSLFNLINLIDKCIIINTIGTGHKIENETSELNKFINFMKINHNDFYEQFILTNRLIYYFATGLKFIYFNNNEQIFIGIRLNLKTLNCKHKEEDKVCELDFFDYNDLLTNNYVNFKLDDSEIKIKYLKYKMKYLNLKKLLYPNN
jgi:hypothetical protein